MPRLGDDAFALVKEPRVQILPEERKGESEREIERERERERKRDR